MIELPDDLPIVERTAVGLAVQDSGGCVPLSTPGTTPRRSRSIGGTSRGGGIETEPADRAEAGSFGQASLCALEHNASLG